MTADAGPTCNAPSATAATTVFAGADGRIVDGDTQLNTLTFGWAVLDAQGNPSDKQDLQSVLTHEIGHLIGLAHPCWSGIGEHAVDDAGNEVPDCYQAPPAIADDTMYPTINPGDISRRVLSPEAVRAVCTLYPAGRPATCAAPADPDAASPPPPPRPPIGVGAGWRFWAAPASCWLPVWSMAGEIGAKAVTVPSNISPSSPSCRKHADVPSVRIAHRRSRPASTKT